VPGQVESLGDRPDTAVGLRRRHAAHREGKTEVVGDAAAEDPRLLPQEPDPVASWSTVHVRAEEPEVARRRGPLQESQESQQGRLTRPVAPDDPELVALPEAELFEFQAEPARVLESQTPNLIQRQGASPRAG
jgi:hypothetical protein